MHDAHEEGLISASYCLAQMYTFGISEYKSLPEALKIIQKVIALPESMLNNLEILKQIRLHSCVQKDYISMLHAQYLLLNGHSKVKPERDEDYRGLQQTMQTVEHQFEQLPADKKGAVANLLYETGAYQALLRRAKENSQVAEQLLAQVNKRIEYYKHPVDQYHELIEFMQTK